ncbi:MAG: sigma-70 family RNA polymerase sigma factor [Pseudomonadota bacterium]
MMPRHLKLVMPAPHDDTPDDVLVERAQRGDRAALGELVVRHQRALFALCMRYVRDTDEAADLVQRAFVRAMTKLSELREAGSFRSWILRIGAHLALNHLRDNARFVSEGDQAERAGTADPGGAALDRLEMAEQAASLRDAVRALPTKQRMTLELRIYEDLSFREIAAALEISEGAAKVNFHYAVRKLRGVLGPNPDGAARHGRGR